MSTQSAGAETRTYVLENDEVADVVVLVAELNARGVLVPASRPALVAADGHRIELPPSVFDALRQVATALSHGQGVTVAPQSTLLTTQEAADFLGISRPTLVRLLTERAIPFEMRGRHRRVMLADLVSYQERARQERREGLAAMSRSAQESGLYDATAGPPPKTR